MKISEKFKNYLNYLFILVILALVILIYLILNYNSRYVFETNSEKLQLLANEKALSLNSFLESKKSEVIRLSSMNIYVSVLLHPENESVIALASELIKEYSPIYGIGILNTTGFIVLADGIPAGYDYSNNPYFLMENKTTYFGRYYDPSRKGDYYGVITPVYNPKNSGEVIGYFFIDLELEKISDFLEVSEIEDGEEVYLADNTGLLLSKSRYIGNGNRHGVLIQEIKSEGMDDCLKDLNEFVKGEYVEEHEEPDLEIYLNYMGDKVVGVHSYVPIINGCILAEKRMESLERLSSTGYVINKIFNGGD